MILVTGATGALGSATIEFLLKKTPASNVAALVRKPEKAAALQENGVEILLGDYNDPESLVKAFEGVDKLYFISGSDVANRISQHQNVVNSAKTAGVKHLVYTSFDRKTEDGSSPIAFLAESHLRTEQSIKESGIPYTLMLHGLYMDLLPTFLGEKVLETGTVYQPSGAGKAAFTLRNDMAEAASVVLTSEGHEGKSYNIVAEEALSYGGIAAIISELTGKEVRHVSPSTDDFVQTLTAAGVPAPYASFYAAFAKAIEAGEFENTQSDITRLIGRKPLKVKEFLKPLYG